MVEHRQLVHREDNSTFNVPGWSGVVHHGRVTAVNKAAETLTVRADGLPGANFGPDYPFQLPLHLAMRFNVRFHTPASRHAPMHLALATAQPTLAKTGWPRGGHMGGRS